MSSTATDRAPVRIAYITTAFPWRSETAVIKEIHALDGHGFHVSVFSLKRVSFDGIFDPKANRFRDRTWYPSAPAVLRGVLRCLGLLVGSRAFRSVLATTLRHSGRYLAKTLYILPLAAEIAARLRRDDVRYVHANFASFQGYAAWVIRRLTGIPFGFTVHAHDIFLDHFMIPEKVADAALVVSISRYNVDYMKRHFGIAAERLDVIHCGVDLDEFQVSGIDGEGPPLLLSVGRLDPMKGFDTLLHGCRLLRDALDFRCVIVGAGEEHARLLARIEEHGLADRVEIRTGVPQAELVELYRRCRLYVQPCRRDPRNGMQDGVPATIMEAMAVGKPVVSTRLSGIPELVEEGVEGLLVEPEDAGGLAAAMRALLQDPERSRRMGAASRRKVEAEFDAAVNARKVGERIRQVVEARASGRGAP